MSVVHDSVFYETSSYSFKSQCLFDTCEKGFQGMSSETGRLACALLALELGYLLIWPFCSNDELNWLPRMYLSLPDVLSISTITLCLILMRSNSCLGEMSRVASLVVLLRHNNPLTFHAHVQSRTTEFSTGINECSGESHLLSQQSHAIFIQRITQASYEAL